MIVSPLIDAGVDSTRYDHSSTCKLLGVLWGLAPLTNRDRLANSPLGTLRSTPRDLLFNLPPPAAPVRPLRQPADRADRPLPPSGNVVGWAAMLPKITLDLAARSPAAVVQPPAAPTTFAEAEAQAADLLAKVRQTKRNSAATPA